MKIKIHKDEILKKFPDLNIRGDYLIFNNAEKIDNKRTNNQNRALHLLFDKVSESCMEKGIDMRELVRDEIPIQCTQENIKWIWKKIQKGLFGSKSTTELRNDGQIDVVYDNFNKIISERSQGEVEIPPFPCMNEQTKNQEMVEYPTEKAEVNKF